MNDMIEVQKVLVADRISQMKADAAEANRSRRAAAEEEFGGEGRAQRHPMGTNGVRERVGRWLVGVGEAIAGAPAHKGDGSSVRHAA